MINKMNMNMIINQNFANYFVILRISLYTNKKVLQCITEVSSLQTNNITIGICHMR